ncbi:MAG: CehA/McbA family metallohydrolase [Planctomycetota bacterium]
MPSTRFFRGNTHCHTSLCGHADAPPEEVAGWYREASYQFLVLSEHDTVIEPDRLRIGNVPGFLLIPGEEVTQDAPRFAAHVNAIGIRRAVPPIPAPLPEASEVLRRTVDAIRAQGGLAQVNHPNFRGPLTVADVEAVPEGPLLLEIWNGHPLSNNDGKEGHPSAEAIWDALLAKGRRIWGVASDDAHRYKIWEPGRSNPGQGWVMVRAQRLDESSILAALAEGDFYASTGVILSGLRAASDTISLSIVGIPGETYRIEFIADGEVVEQRDGLEAAFRRPGGKAYLRARILASSGRRAWIQPLFP